MEVARSSGRGRHGGTLLLVLRVVLGSALTLGIAIGLFWIAGGWGWWAGWAYFGVFGVLHGAVGLYLRRVSPEMLRSRGRLGLGTKRWDLAWLAVFAVLLLATLCVAALEWRSGTGRMPVLLWPLGFVLHAASLLFVTRAMAVNPHFEKTVRIQHDRGHRVIDVGPYARVRHPGYVGISGILLAAPLLLLSWGAFVPALVTIAWLVLRTALEDRTLRAELSGYEDYASRVRYRLVPGLW